MLNVYIDGDLLVHQSIWGSNSKNDVKKKLNSAILNIMKTTEADNGKIAVRGPDNFRREIYPAYKANRKKEMTEKERELFDYSYNQLESHWGAEKATGMEADDLLAIWHTETPGIIASLDKDMLQVPGLHYNFRSKEFQYIEEEEASYLLHLQMLTGDSTDNIKGLKGIGPVKAKKILAGVPAKRHLNRVKAAWRANHGLGWERELQLNTDLLYLRRSHDDRYLIK